MDYGKSISPFDCLMFDLDDTLYSSHTGIGQALKKNIEAFLVEKCDFTSEQAASLRVELFKSYGSTLAGLRALGYDIDADDYTALYTGGCHTLKSSQILNCVTFYSASPKEKLYLQIQIKFML
ncbi:Uncharacterized protein RDABS01_014081 [Bienertia sinuspersici]